MRRVLPGILTAAAISMGIAVPAHTVDAKATATQLSASDRFSLNLYKTLVARAGKSANVIVSPYSVAEALAMVRAGANGATAEQLDTALAGKSKRIEPANRKTLREQLLQEFVPGSGTYTRIANSLWTAKGYPLDPAFADLASNSYAAKIEALDFSGDPGGASKKINDWVSDTTEQQINQIVDPIDIDPLTRAVLANSVLFHGRWAEPFNKALTTQAPFSAPGRKVQVPTMTGQADVTVSPTMTTVSKGFNGSYRMRIAMPKTSTATALDTATTTLFTGSVPTGEACHDLPLHLPKWNTSSDFDLIPPLKKIGITDLFDANRADLTGVSPMAGLEGLYISKAVQKATVAVDEEGTVAAALTGLFARAVSANPNFGPCPSEVKVNRPFAFVIQHTVTGEVLFAGRVMNPAA